MSAELELYEEALEQANSHMSTLEHSTIAITISSEIRSFIKGKNLGRVFDSSAEYRFLEKADDQARRPSRQPDVSFVRQERLPQRLRSYPDIAPDLAVEIVSPYDIAYQIQAKIKEYQQAGVRLVWLVLPYLQQIEIYRFTTGLIPQTVGVGDELSGEDVLPGFVLPVSEIFDFPADPNPEPDK